MFVNSLVITPNWLLLAERGYVCPMNDMDIPNSAEYSCNKDSNAYCNKTTEMCCPYGAGTKCMLKSGTVVKPPLFPSKVTLYPTVSSFF